MPRTLSRFVAGLFLLVALIAAGRSQETSPGAEIIDGKYLADWIRDLKNADPFVRQIAAQTLAKYGSKGKEAVPALISRLRDPDADVFLHSMAALQAIGFTDKEHPEIVKNLIVTVQKGAMPARIQGCMALAQIGGDARSAISALSLSVIKDPYSWTLRRSAAYALGRIAWDQKSGPDITAIRALCGAISGSSADSCAQVRLEAILALGGLGKPKVPTELTTEVNALIYVIKNDKDVQVVIWARALLAVYDDMNAEQHVTFIHSRMLKSTDPIERSNATNALGALGALSKDKVPDIIKLLGDADQVVAGSAVTALGQMKDHLSDVHIGTLTKLCRTGADSQTRTLAINVMGSLGERAKPFVEELIVLLKDNDESVANAASTSLGQLSAELEEKKSGLSDQQVGSVAALLTHSEPRVRAIAAQTIALLGFKAESYIPKLVTALGDRDPKVVGYVIVALVSFGMKSKEAIPTLEKMDKHSDPGIREASKLAIAQILGILPKDLDKEKDKEKKDKDKEKKTK